MTNYREMIGDAIMDVIVFKVASLIHGHLPGWADVNERYRAAILGQCLPKSDALKSDEGLVNFTKTRLKK